MSISRTDAAGPGNDLSREHGAHAGLLSDRHQQGVHPGRVRARELGDVADAHQLRRVGVAPVDLDVAFERRGKAEADGLDDGVDQIPDAPALERLDGGGERIQALAEVGNRHDARAGARELAGHLAVGAVDAEHELSPGLDRGPDLVRLEAVDAHPHAGAAELANHLAQGGKGDARRTAEVDDVRAARLEVLGGGADRLRGSAWGRC